MCGGQPETTVSEGLRKGAFEGGELHILLFSPGLVSVTVPGPGQSRPGLGPCLGLGSPESARAGTFLWSPSPSPEAACQ